MVKKSGLWLFLPYGKGSAYFNRLQRISALFLLVGLAIGLISQLSEESASGLGVIAIVFIGVAIPLLIIGTIVGISLARKLGERIEMTANAAMNLHFANYLNSFDPLSPYFVNVDGIPGWHSLGDNIPDAALMVRQVASDFPISRLVIINIHNWGFAMVPYNWGWDYWVSEHFTLESGETS